MAQITIAHRLFTRSRGGICVHNKLPSVTIHSRFWLEWLLGNYKLNREEGLMFKVLLGLQRGASVVILQRLAPALKPLHLRLSAFQLEFLKK